MVIVRRVTCRTYGYPENSLCLHSACAACSLNFNDNCIARSILTVDGFRKNKAPEIKKSTVDSQSIVAVRGAPRENAGANSRLVVFGTFRPSARAAVFRVCKCAGEGHGFKSCPRYQHYRKPTQMWAFFMAFGYELVGSNPVTATKIHKSPQSVGFFMRFR